MKELLEIGAGAVGGVAVGVSGAATLTATTGRSTDLAGGGGGLRLYHVTVLSNFVLGYDKYGRRYAKGGIPGSTFPDQFFLLGRDELSIGEKKAGRLLGKLGLPGDRLIVLETRVAEDELRADHATGLGRYVGRGWIAVEAVHWLAGEGEGELVPARVEEMAALSLRVREGELVPFAALRPRSVSVLPIAIGCQAACPFCFSRSSVSLDQDQGRLDLDRVKTVFAEARARGAGRAVITGGGEPALYRWDRLLELIRLAAAFFPKVVLITNGYKWAQMEVADRLEALRELAAAGLSVLSVSRHHHDGAANAGIMHLDTGSERLAATWSAHRDELAGLKLRWICVLQKGGVETREDIGAYLDWAAETGVGEVCFKELYVAASVESEYYQRDANDWSCAHQVPLGRLLELAAEEGWRRVGELPWGAPIFRGQRRGRPLQVAAYTEPSVLWERTRGECRSWNLMADGRCLASLEDRASGVLEEAGG